MSNPPKKASVKKVVKVSPKETSQVKPSPIHKSQSHDELTMQHVKECISLLKQNQHFNTFSYKTKEFQIEIELRTTSSQEKNFHLPSTTSPISIPSPEISAPISSNSNVVATKPTTEVRLDKNLFEVRSPMIGTFYRSPNPGAPPYVSEGDMVSNDTQICIIEVMKLLTTIPAECTGKVVKILVPDATPVEANQVLMLINPS